MRIIRFVAEDGRILHGREHGDGTAEVVIDAIGALGIKPTACLGEFLRGKSVLVADDDELMRRLIRTVLDKVGCRCTMCADGTAALQAIEQDELDLIISDIRMPDVTGYEIFAAAHTRRPDVPVMLITGFGYDPSHSLLRASREGQQAVLYKPFTPQQLLNEVCRALHTSEGSTSHGLVQTSEAVSVDHLLAPLQPTNIICVGRNYAADDAIDAPPPEELEVFLKPTSSVQSPRAPIRIPCFDAVEPQVDCEGELAVIIGITTRDVSESEALDHVLGYTAANDVTARHWQAASAPSWWMRGKGFDTFCPLGPSVITPDSLGSPDALDIRTLVNGRVVRSGNTGQMIRPVARLISELSRHLTLQPGTVVLTGAPPRITNEAPAPIGLQPGDEVVVEIDGIGRLVNPVETS